VLSAQRSDNGEYTNDYQINADNVGNYPGPDHYDNTGCDGDNTGNKPDDRKKLLKLPQVDISILASLLIEFNTKQF